MCHWISHCTPQPAISLTASSVQSATRYSRRDSTLAIGATVGRSIVTVLTVFIAVSPLSLIGMNLIGAGDRRPAGGRTGPGVAGTRGRSHAYRWRGGRAEETRGGTS